jgi:hypothetical protein
VKEKKATLGSPESLGFPKLKKGEKETGRGKGRKPKENRIQKKKENIVFSITKLDSAASF